MKSRYICIILFLVLAGFLFSYGFSRKEEVVKAELVKDDSNIVKKENKKK